MDYKEKLQRIIFEYTLRPDNQHCGTGTGGNLEHYMFIADKKIVQSEKIESIKISGDELICNLTYIVNTSSKEVRDKLDEQIAAAIAETHFVSPIRYVKEGSVYKVVADEIDLEKDSLAARMAIAARKCADFSKQLEAGNLTDDVFTDLVAYLSSVEIPVALFALRTQVGIERIVRFELDEHKVLGPFLQQINKQMDSLAA
jgi:hypothetical protein